MGELKELVRPYYLKWLYFRWKKENCPPSFKECWKYPTTGIETLPQELESAGAGNGNRHDIVFLPMADWHMYVQRSQHFATTLSAMGYHCLYVSPHLGREFPQTYFTSPRILVSTLGPRLLEFHVHLIREPVFHQRCLRPDENAVVAAAIEGLLRRTPPVRATMMVSFPVWGDIAVQFRERFGCKVVYDCHDNLTGFDDISHDLLEAEQRLIDDSDLIVFSAEYLMESVLAQHPAARNKSVLVRNAVNALDFQAAPSRVSGEGAGMQKVIGYAGALNFWFDTESVKRAALAHPEWRFELIGPVASRKLDVLRSIPNIVFMGLVAYAELAPHLSRMDVAIIPFLKSPLTLATNPVKLYEYFACGLPVVSTRLPELEQFLDLVYPADNPDEFLLQIEKALQEDDPTLRDRRLNIARQESWVARCALLGKAIQNLDSSMRPPTSTIVSITD